MQDAWLLRSDDGLCVQQDERVCLLPRAEIHAAMHFAHPCAASRPNILPFAYLMALTDKKHLTRKRQGSRESSLIAQRRSRSPASMGSPRAVALVVNASLSGRPSQRWLPQIMNPTISNIRGMGVCVEPAGGIGATAGPQPIALDGIGAPAERLVADIGGRGQPNRYPVTPTPPETPQKSVDGRPKTLANFVALWSRSLLQWRSMVNGLRT